MVNIYYPSTNYEFFFRFQGCVVTNVTSPFMVQEKPVTVDSPLDALAQGHEARSSLQQGREYLGGENSVDHQKVEANITVSLMRFESVSGLPGNPHAVTFQYQGKPIVCSMGIFEHGASYITNANTPGVCVWGFIREGDTYHLVQRTYEASTKSIAWHDVWTRHIPINGTSAKFVRGMSSFSEPGDYTDINLDSAFNLIAMTPSAKGTVMRHSSLGSATGPYSVYFRTMTKMLPTMRKVIQSVASAAYGMSLTKCPIEDYDYGSLALEATDASRVNEVNMLAFIADIRNPKSMVPKLKNLRNLPKDTKLLKGLRNASEDYLTYHYGVLPTVDDVNSILNAARKCSQYYDRNGYVVYTAGHETVAELPNSSWQVLQRIKLATAADDLVFSSIIRGFDNIGLFPSYENVWDLIPFSFVVDWFINVGDFLEDYDNLLRLSRLNVQYVTMSKKTTATQVHHDPETGASGTLSLVQYHRWVTRQCPVPKLALSKTSQISTHWVESSALILSRTRH